MSIFYRHECTNVERIEEGRYATNARMEDELKKRDAKYKIY